MPVLTPGRLSRGFNQATSEQRLMVEGAIDRRIEITVWRNSALVNVIAVPRELVGT
jgi:hypothetical protein